MAGTVYPGAALCPTGDRRRLEHHLRSSSAAAYRPSRRGRRLGQRLACPRTCPSDRSSCCSSCSSCSPPAAAEAATTPATSRASPWSGKGGRRAGGAGPRLPRLATKNTTRVGGADAGRRRGGRGARGLPRALADTRPAAVTLVDVEDWRAALSRRALMAGRCARRCCSPTATTCPTRRSPRSTTLAPDRAPRAPATRRSSASADGRARRAARRTDVAGADPLELAAAIDTLQTAARRRADARRDRRAVDAPEFAMPAAAWAAKTGDPVLFATRTRVPPATTRRAQRPPASRGSTCSGRASAISDKVRRASSSELGTVARIAGAGPGRPTRSRSRASPTGDFGWGVVDPGHGLVFANAAAPARRGRRRAAVGGGHLRAAAAARPRPTRSRAPLQDYLLDIQPGYYDDPVRGVYNHGWIVGDEEAISVDVQSRIDALLEIAPGAARRNGTSPHEPSRAARPPAPRPRGHRRATCAS